MNKKISELLETIDLNDEDILMILQSGQNKKIKAMNAFKKINSKIDNINDTLIKVSPTEPSPKSDIWFRKGKNLLNLLDCIFIPNRSTASVVSKNKNEITIKGTAGTFKYVDLRFFLKAGTYTIQRKWELISGTRSNFTGLVAINDVTTDSPIDLGYIAQAGTSKTFTIDHDAQIRLYLYLSGDTALSDETQARFYDMQIVKGSAEEEFKEYVEPEIYVKNNNNEYMPFDLKQELDVASLLQNNWQGYYLCQIFKVNNVVHIQICVKSGTETTVAILPEGYRPKELLFFPMTVATGDGIVTDPYGSLSQEGELQCPQMNVGKLIFMNFSFLVE